MGTFSKTSYKSISVNMDAMGKLADRLRTDSEKLKVKVDNIEKDLKELGYDWEDDNYAAFVMYFAESHSLIMRCNEFFEDQAEWLDKMVPLYESLPDDLQAATKARLRGVGQ